MTKYVQDYLPGFFDAEAKVREADIEAETFKRRQQALAIRWFGYYKLAQKRKRQEELIKQYNRIATMRQRS